MLYVLVDCQLAWLEWFHLNQQQMVYVLCFS
jgi:hypothetical protein